VFGGVVPGNHAIYRENPDKKNDWLQIARVTVRNADVNIGIVDSTVSRLLVTISEPDGTAPWQISGVHLGEAGTPFGLPRHQGKAPAEPGQPWVFSNMEPGRYALLVHRMDGVQWRTEITLDNRMDDWELSVQTPESSAQIFVQVVGATTEALTFWRANKDILCAVMPDAQGRFGIDNLPAGRYFIGSTLDLLYDTPALAEVCLNPHTSQTVDLDLSIKPIDKVAHLVVQVVDENGIVRDDAHLRLEGALGSIEPTYSSRIGHVFLTTPGHHTLRLEMAGYRRTARDVTLKAVPAEAGKPQTLRIVLEPL
jgi:hypothetical protein